MKQAYIVASGIKHKTENRQDMALGVVVASSENEARGIAFQAIPAEFYSEFIRVAAIPEEQFGALWDEMYGSQSTSPSSVEDHNDDEIPF